MSRALVTGGCGFVGSHLVDRLMEDGWEVVVLDDLSSGSEENVGGWLDNRGFRLVVGDCRDEGVLQRAMGGCGVVFHLAASSEVRVGVEDTAVDFERNVVATRGVLEGVRRVAGVGRLVFASTSTVYGEASVVPTPEGYGPLAPISLYGASKLACEALVAGYSSLFGVVSVVFRFANVVGSRSGHGVVFDFVEKLRGDPLRLEVLGDGAQEKSYLHVEDCVEALLYGLTDFDSLFTVLNVGTEDRVDVAAVAGIVCEAMGLEGVEFVHVPWDKGGRGWPGDVRSMLLDAGRLRALGWRPRYGSAEAVRRAAEELAAAYGGG